MEMIKIDNKTFFNITEIDNVQIMGDIFLDYPNFDNCNIVGATYQQLDLDEDEIIMLNEDRALVQVICLDYLANICNLDNIG